MRSLFAVAMLLLSTPAFAADFYVEGPAVSDKAQASAMADTALADGLRARVVRRYQTGAGWEYVVRVEGFDSQGPAADAAHTLAAAIAAPVAVFLQDGAEARKVALIAPGDVHAAVTTESVAKADDMAVTATQGADGGGAPRGPLPEPGGALTELLTRVVQAYGGTSAGIVALEKASDVVFRFRRIVPNGPTVRHTFARHGGDEFMEVVVEKGVGTSSRTQLLGGHAWLSAGGQPATAQDAERTSEVLAQLAPEHVLAFTLGLARAVEGRKELRSLVQEGSAKIDGLPCVLLKYGGDPVSPPLTLAVDTRDWLVRQATFSSDQGDLVKTFSDYRDDGPVVVPHKIVTRRGDRLVDEIDVLEVDLNPKLSADWFVPPGTTTL